MSKVKTQNIQACIKKTSKSNFKIFLFEKLEKFYFFVHLVQTMLDNVVTKKKLELNVSNSESC